MVYVNLGLGVVVNYTLGFGIDDISNFTDLDVLIISLIGHFRAST